MPSINLHHPIWITVEPLDKAATVADSNAREAIQIIGRKPTLRILAQIEYREYASHGTSAEYDRGGLKEDEEGYILIRTVDRKSLGWEPQIGDKIAERGTDGGAPDSSPVYVVRLKPTMHYPIIGPLGLKLYFSDRGPSHGG